MLKNGEYVYNQQEDALFKIAESINPFRKYMWAHLYDTIQKDGKLNINNSITKEEIIDKIRNLLIMGLELGHETMPSEVMCKYFEDEFGVECMLEFIRRENRTYQFDDRHHDYKYVEKDLPLADAAEIEEWTAKITNWGNDYRQYYPSAPLLKSLYAPTQSGDALVGETYGTK